MSQMSEASSHARLGSSYVNHVRAGPIIGGPKLRSVSTVSSCLACIAAQHKAYMVQYHYCLYKGVMTVHKLDRRKHILPQQ